MDPDRFDRARWEARLITHEKAIAKLVNETDDQYKAIQELEKRLADLERRDKEQDAVIGELRDKQEKMANWLRAKFKESTNG